MDGADASTHYDPGIQSQDQAPSLLTVILDTHPAAWALISDTLPLSNAISALLVFINAHLASNYTNQVAVIASHCDRAQWLYPTPVVQQQSRVSASNGQSASGAEARLGDGDHEDDDGEDVTSHRNTRPRQNGSTVHNTSSKSNDDVSEDMLADTYRPFALIKHAITTNLAALLASTSPQAVRTSTSTKISGALSMALSYIHRLTQQYQEALTGRDGPDFDSSNTNSATDPAGAGNMTLQSRILLINLCPSADLAHQYIPIMNNIFACQRQNIPIDVLQLPLDLGGQYKTQMDQKTTNTIDDSSTATTSSSSVFLQQAADATHGIFMQAIFPALTTSPSSNTATAALLTYLLTTLTPPPHLRPLLTTPQNPNVDFRAACFCHRDIISTGFVCSICLSIFCEASLDTLIDGGQGCLTCGTVLSIRREGVGGFGARPVVVSAVKSTKKRKAV